VKGPALSEDQRIGQEEENWETQEDAEGRPGQGGEALEEGGDETRRKQGHPIPAK